MKIRNLNVNQNNNMIISGNANVQILEIPNCPQLFEKQGKRLIIKGCTIKGYSHVQDDGSKTFGGLIRRPTLER